MTLILFRGVVSKVMENINSLIIFSGSMSNRRWVRPSFLTKWTMSLDYSKSLVPSLYYFFTF